MEYAMTAPLEPTSPMTMHGFQECVHSPVFGAQMPPSMYPPLGMMMPGPMQPQVQPSLYENLGGMWIPPTYFPLQMPMPVPMQPQPVTTPLSEYEFDPVTIARDSLCEDLGVTVDGALVTHVAPGKLGSMSGIVRGMTIEAIDDEEASNERIAHAFDNCLTFTLKVSCTCLATLRGEVDSWDLAKGAGWISPSLPVYIGSATWGAKTVYFGNVRCTSANLPSGVTSLAPKQKVEFMLSASGTHLIAHQVTGPRGDTLQNYAPALQPGLMRALSIDDATPGVCAQYAKGLCPFDGDICPSGLHPKTTGLPKKKKKVEKNNSRKEKVVFSVGWDVVTIATEGIGKDVVYYKNDDAPRNVTKVGFNTISRCLVLTCQQECEEILEQVLPDGCVASLLSNIAEVCTQSNVCCVLPEAITESTQVGKRLLTEVGERKLALLRADYEEACQGEDSWGVIKAWEVRGDLHKETFHNAEQSLMHKLRRPPQIRDTYYGLPEGSVLDEAVNGFPSATLQHSCPNRASEHCCGGSFMFRCKTALGVEGDDYTVAPHEGYNVNEGYSVPCYLLQFGHSDSRLSEELRSFAVEVHEDLVPLTQLGERLRGGTGACKGRTESAMMAATTKHIWVGWLEPEFEQTDEDIALDVKEHLAGHKVVFTKIERNAARIGAFVELGDPVTQCQLAEINTRLYKGQYVISADDMQPSNPWTSSRPCPRLLGPAKYCRGWNIKGHNDWTESCSFNHRVTDNILHRAPSRYMTHVFPDAPQYAELAFEVHGKQLGHVVGMEQVHNSTLADIYEKRKRFLSQKHGADAIVERELWFGTDPYTLSQVCSNGIQPPSDTLASPACPVSGGKGLVTTACGRCCLYCIEPHVYSGCHKYGLGVKLTADAAAAHKDVTPIQKTGVHSLVRCKVNLGRPYVIDKNLVKPDAMHCVVRAVDPEGRVGECTEEWCTATGHDSYVVRNSDVTEVCVVFHPYQILPEYIVHYKLGEAPSVPQHSQVAPQEGIRIPPPQYMPPPFMGNGAYPMYRR
eukprot:TRINITY_DN46578_c0_g1_i1.p1 TRINITY_DN46578_c0_g1~~TRINITY_DN46578_c0_g1_i1.p1  ORF type:complete len:1049 (+),score=226.78 TRINITY_DN46578_c0_g1_i1:82-3147(+)